ncbi:hypothetical protein EYF80_029293 [Liparis tanakae]|uniref:Uncharacterized protein n=1 Tax=Liparis tanakae TaxID=230148 RepID=A0A4Z2H6D6_9TELE|nr:hypothetical protein EYF80_029293 [Liparis tanakae]
MEAARWKLLENRENLDRHTSPVAGVEVTAQLGLMEAQTPAGLMCMSSRVEKEEEEEEEEEAAAAPGAIWTGPISITTDNGDVKMRAAASSDDSSLIKWETQSQNLTHKKKFTLKAFHKLMDG